jgi:hypothetical protein
MEGAMNGTTGVNGNGSERRVAGEPPVASARKEIFGIVERNENSFWTKIGVAFENRDGSWNLRFDYLPSRPDVKVQLREPREPREREPAER